MATLYFCLVWLLAGFMTGLTSFGSNLIAVPLIMLVYDVRSSILIGCIGASIIFLGLALHYRKAIIWHDTILLVLGSFAGIPAGIWFLKNASLQSLLLTAGGSLLLFLFWQLLSGYFRLDRTSIKSGWAIPLGIVSGIMMGCVGMGGPPLVVYIFLRRYTKEQTISTINAASVGIMLGVLPWQYFSGLYPDKIMLTGLAGGFCGLVGIALSLPLIRKLNIGLFRTLLLCMIALAALSLIWKGI